MFWKIFSSKFLTILSVVIFLAIFLLVIFRLDFTPSKITWGVTFSPYYIQTDLGLDWREVYLAILDDLKADHLRLSAYWSYLEPEPNQYHFDDLDWQIDQAAAKNAKITLAIGRRLPRWPECHDPNWLQNKTVTEIDEAQLALIEKIVSRYKDNEQIVYWQVENEPFLGTFGKCPRLNQELLEKEISLVRKLSSKPIIITDSGELSLWLKAAETGADILGTTLYRVVYNEKLGYQRFPLPPAFYTFKAWYVREFFDIKQVIISELQAESWHPTGKNISQMTLAEHNLSLSLKQFKKNIDFAQKTGSTENYLWGVEWWYYMKVKQNEPGYWQEAKKLWPQF